jgi:hypothetical protein
MRKAVISLGGIGPIVGYQHRQIAFGDRREARQDARDVLGRDDLPRHHRPGALRIFGVHAPPWRGEILDGQQSA